MSATWVIIDVGCLECSEWSEVLYAGPNEEAARDEFDRINRARAARLVDPGHWVRPDDSVLAEGPVTLMDARGTGGSYFYPVQLHRFEA